MECPLVSADDCPAKIPAPKAGKPEKCDRAGPGDRRGRLLSPNRLGGSAGPTGPSLRPWWLRGADGRLALLGVNALSELLHDLAAEGVEVVGLAARHQARIDVYLLVDPVPAGVADVGLEARPRGDRAPLQHIRLDERPGPVADHADRLAGLEEGADERHRLRDRSQVVRICDASWKHQAVVVGRVRVADRAIDVETVACVQMVERLDVSFLGRDQLRLCARLANRLPWPSQLDLLGSLIRNDERDLLALKLIGHVFSFPGFPWLRLPGVPRSYSRPLCVPVRGGSGQVGNAPRLSSATARPPRHGPRASPPAPRRPE